MLRNQWNQTRLKQCINLTGQVLQEHQQSLVQANQDFGRLVSGEAAAVFCPRNLPEIQSILRFANDHRLPLTIRANGLSQAGQSLAPAGGVSLDISQLNDKVLWRDGKLIAGCAASWKFIITTALKQNSLPPVVPYNTNLTLGGVLSVGGLGASSFKQGITGAHIEALLVVTPQGEQVRCSRQQEVELFDACLSGAGLFGIIIEAELNVRPCKQYVRRYCLTYDNYHKWLDDEIALKPHVDYLEAFIDNTPACPPEKTYIINIGYEYDENPPELNFNWLQSNKIEHAGDMTLLEYMYRHDPRIQAMKDTGAWHTTHPWYECFVDRYALLEKLNDIVPVLDENIGGIYHIFPVALNSPKYCILPQTDNVVMFNILPPGIEKNNTEKVINALLKVNDMLLGIGGKRYISGWFPQGTDERYWLNHYENFYQERKEIKLKYDPNQIFCSQLFPSY